MVLLFLVILLFCNFALLPTKIIGKEEGKLSLFEEEIEKESKDDNHNEDQEEDDDSQFWDLLFNIFDFTEFLIDKFDEDKYRDNYYNYEPVANINKKNFDDISLKVSLATHFVSENITGLRLNSKLGLSRFGLELNFSDYIEELKNGNNHLYFSEGLFTIDFSSTQDWEFIGGIGWHNVSGNKNNLGLKLAYKMSYSKKPITPYFDFGTSYFKNSNLLELEPGLSYNRGNFEIKVAYRVLKVSNQNLKGPELRLIYHFD
jgi:hypothetical protein